MSGRHRSFNRREILTSTGRVAGAAAMTAWTSAAYAREPHADATGTADKRDRPVLCLFSKPLQNRPFDQLPPLLNELGIDALDLTCRPGGHVLPERVEEDLPRAVQRLNSAGIAVPMITTGILDADSDNAEAIVGTAARLGIRYIKLGYYDYDDLRHIDRTLTDVKNRLLGLAALFERHGVRAGVHNHSGKRVGAPMWDLSRLLADLPVESIGSYFDIRHATAEGGDAGWRIGMHLLAPHIMMAAVKDFLWHRDDEGNWRIRNVPLGEGMVRLEPFLEFLKQQRFAGPLSVHMEHGDHRAERGSEWDRYNIKSIGRDWRYMKDICRRINLI